MTNAPRKTPVHNTREPMLRFNGSGYGVEWTKIIQLVVLIGGVVWIGGAASARLDQLEDKLEVAPKEVLSEVRNLKNTVTHQLLEIRRTAETARVQRTHEIEELEKRASASEADRSQLNAKVENLSRTVEETNKIIKERYSN